MEMFWGAHPPSDAVRRALASNISGHSRRGVTNHTRGAYAPRRSLRKRFRQGAAFAADEGAGGDVMRGKTAVVYFEGVEDFVVGGDNGHGIVLFEVMDLFDDAIGT